MVDNTEMAERSTTSPATSALPGLTLEQHREHIVASGISDFVALKYGLRGVYGSGAMEFGFKGEQARDGLLIPLYWGRPKPVLYQLRPWVQRIGPDGRPIKYETPVGKPNVLATFPAWVDAIPAPHVPLVFTEGTKKLLAWATKLEYRGASKLRLNGVAVPDPLAVSFMGVRGWMGANEFGGRGIPLAAMREIPFRGEDAKGAFKRQVILAFDSDVTTKPDVHAALVELHDYLISRGAEVWIMYLPSANGAKVGLDDFLAAGHSLQDALNCCEPKLRPMVTDTLAIPFGAYSITELRQQLGSSADIEHILSGYIVRGHVTLLCAEPKAGKTTFLMDAVRAIVTGDKRFIGRDVHQGRVFWVDLEMGTQQVIEWAERRGLAEQERFKAWSGHKSAIQDGLLRQAIVNAKADLVIVDSWSKWTMEALAGRGEGDNPTLTREMQFIVRIARELNVAVVVVHHIRKAPGSFFEMIRGGGATFADVDIAVLLLRAGKTVADPRRRLEATGRFNDITPAELVVTRTEKGYEVTAEGAAAGRDYKFTEGQREALQAFFEAGQPITIKEWDAAVKKRFNKGAEMTRKARRVAVSEKLVVEMVDQEHWQATQAGWNFARVQADWQVVEYPYEPTTAIEAIL